MKRKLIIFDLDGTLVDTVEDLKVAVNVGLAAFNQPTKDLHFVTKAIGNGVETLIARCLENGFDNPFYKDVLNVFRNYYLEHYDVYTKPYMNVLDTLLRLKEKGYILSVCTNKLHEAAVQIINKYFSNIFAYVLGSKPNIPKKPNPQMIEQILDYFNVVDKKEVVYIGDTNVDIEVANNAKIPFILVSYGYRNKKELEKIDSQAKIIDKFEDLLDLF